MKFFNKHKGFTLLEVMLAGAILGIGCLGVLAMLTTAQETNNVSASSTNAVVVGETIISTLENETRNCTFTPASGGASAAINCSGTTYLNRIASATSNSWILFESDSGLVNTLGQSKSVADASSTVPLRYCVGFYKINAAYPNLLNGSVRIFWRKDNKPFTQDNADCSISGKSFADLDSISGARTSGLEFISLPFSFRIN